jgi:hypothetical protein
LLTFAMSRALLKLQWKEVKVKKQWNEAVDPIKAEMVTHYWNCSSELAQKELNFSPRNPMETLQDTIQWIKDNEFLLPIPLHSKL